MTKNPQRKKSGFDGRFLYIVKAAGAIAGFCKLREQ